MAVKRVSRSFKDISLSFDAHPVTKDLTVLKNENAITRSVRNLIQTIPTERFFNSVLGSEVRDSLFDFVDFGTASVIQDQIVITLQNFEPRIDNIRRRNHKRYMRIFEKYEEYFYLPRPTEKSDPSWFAFPLTIKDGAPFTRSDICQFLEDNKIQTRQYFGGNIMLNPGYTHLMDSEDVIKRFPNARKVTTDTFFLGTSPVLNREKINYVGDKIDEFFKGLK